MIMTSNIGSGYLIDHMTEDGTIPEDVKEHVTGELKNYFRPEFLNRIDDIIVFGALTMDQVSRIIELSLASLEKRLSDRNMGLVLTDEAKKFIAKEAYDPQYGARPVKRYLQKYVETEIASMIIRGELVDGGRVIIETEGEGEEEHLAFRMQDMLQKAD